MSSLYDPRREHDACGVGFIAHLDGIARHSVIEMALTAMGRMAHRGASGDGAGMLFPIPADFFRSQWRALPQEQWAVGQLFLPADPTLRKSALSRLNETLSALGLSLADGRDVPAHPNLLSPSAQASMPAMQQILVLPQKPLQDDESFERLLFLARRLAEKAVWADLEGQGLDRRLFSIPSLSCRSIVYKALVPGAQLSAFYPDLDAPDCAAPFAVFHERFSTNTLPAWPLVQPFHLIAHNGEINTLQGNIARMKAREPMLKSSLLGPKLAEILPVINEDMSDSGIFDSVLELLVRGGWPLLHALMAMIPEPFGPEYVMGDNKRAFYEYHAALMEPWDGPTAMVFTDGRRRVGALLDRNGLRPCRYSVTQDGLVVLGSETGIADIPEEKVIRHGQLAPRRMIVADMERHRLAPDAEIKGRYVREFPYRRWIRQYGLSLDKLYGNAAPNELPPLDMRLSSYGLDESWIKRILIPMAEHAQEPVESMGNDLQPALMDERPQSLFGYFKQRFSQITNPAIDPLREQLSMSLMGHVGREGNLLEPEPQNCAMLRLPHPFLTGEELNRIRASQHPALRPHTLDATFSSPAAPAQVNESGSAAGEELRRAMEALFAEAAEAVRNGASILILSDKGMSRGRAPMPILLVTAGLRNYLMEQGLCHACSLIVESGEPCEVMHMAQLIGYGAGAIYPHAALDAISRLAEEGRLDTSNPREAQDRYITALKKGLLKAFARLGISTLRSFLGSHPFDILGLSHDVAQRYFTGTPCLPGGADLNVLARDACRRHELAFAEPKKVPARHIWTPESVKALRTACTGHDEAAWAKFAELADPCGRPPVLLRDLLRFKPQAAIPLDEVEPAEAIFPRFVGAAMSFGAISDKAHRTIAMACNALGAASNCGEGGENPDRNTAPSKEENPRSAIRQIASGRFGVTAEYLAFADEIQIKAAQGAKPGEGGQLPGSKVTAEIARVRGTIPGVTLISPPPHHDIYSIEDLAQLIHDLRHFHPRVRISVKLVAEHGVGTIAVGVAKAGADIILISGHDGGTGACPHSAIHYVGDPWELGLSEAHQALCAAGLRQQVILQTDGLLRTGRDVAVAAMLGAETFGFGTALLVSMGCVLCRKCMKGACPAGIATQDPELCARFKGSADNVKTYLRFVAEDLRRHMAKLGFRTLNEMVGRADCLEQLPESHEKSAGIALAPLLEGPALNRPAPLASQKIALSGLEKHISDAAAPVLAGLTPYALVSEQVHNTDRSVGAHLSGLIIRSKGAQGLPRDSIAIRLSGQAGQSLGAFLAPGVRLDMYGQANDYVGKGLSGGIITVRPGKGAQYIQENQSAIGNVALYGATSGELYCCGRTGERFAVRNSGATAVVEGVGDHGCEYMTGGIVVVLGACGYNFGAGMSGGVAFIFDADERFQNRCNTESVDLESVWQDQDKALLQALLERHRLLTGSAKASHLLEHWDASLPLFVKVVPLDYKETLRRQVEALHGDEESTSSTEEVYPRTLNR
ncbi:MAG: glutamate synthase large subunit [Desulfovibrionaceae bacterium]|nr:glutamate synthase large subunit [Desulfovibrionaceae bacterium]